MHKCRHWVLTYLLARLPLLSRQIFISRWLWAGSAALECSWWLRLIPFYSLSIFGICVCYYFHRAFFFFFFFFFLLLGSVLFRFWNSELVCDRHGSGIEYTPVLLNVYIYRAKQDLIVNIPPKSTLISQKEPMRLVPFEFDSQLAASRYSQW